MMEQHSGEYRIRSVDAEMKDGVPEEVWAAISPLAIDCFPWDTTGYRPSAAAKLFYTRDCFYVRLEAREEHIRAVNTRPNSDVCRDSCVEWFVNPAPQKNDKYINFEINPLGTLHVAVGPDRHDRTMIEGDIYRMIRITPYIDSPLWRVDCAVPFAFFEALLGPVAFTAGHVMKANLYKCGDLTRNPHYGCWNAITWPKPDFHRPEFFGLMTMEH